MGRFACGRSAKIKNGIEFNDIFLYLMHCANLIFDARCIDVSSAV